MKNVLEHAALFAYNMCICAMRIICAMRSSAAQKRCFVAVLGGKIIVNKLRNTLAFLSIFS